MVGLNRNQTDRENGEPEAASNVDLWAYHGNHKPKPTVACEREVMNINSAQRSGKRTCELFEGDFIYSTDIRAPI